MIINKKQAFIIGKTIMLLLVGQTWGIKAFHSVAVDDVSIQSGFQAFFLSADRGAANGRKQKHEDQDQHRTDKIDSPYPWEKGLVIFR